MTLVERLRLGAHNWKDPMLAEAADRIETLEASLRAIREGDKHDRPRVLFINRVLGEEK